MKNHWKNIKRVENQNREREDMYNKIFGLSSHDSLNERIEGLDKFLSSGAKKNDNGKPDFTQIPQLALLEVARVFTYGGTQYGEFNYSEGMEYRRYISACFRHVNKWLRREDIDEIGTNHLANAIASLMMALDNQLTNKGIDNRNKVYLK